MDHLSYHAQNNPNAIAIECKEDAISYESLYKTCQAYAKHYSVTIHDKRIGIGIKDPLTAIYAILGALYAGKTIYLLNHHLKTVNKDLLSAYQLKTVITESSPFLNSTFCEHPINDLNTASIRLFTTGSSGNPKCVIHSINTLVASAVAINTALDFVPGDRWLCQLPFYHVSGLAILWRTITAGATLHLSPTKTPYTHISCVEKQFKTIITQPHQPSLKCILLGGSFIKKELLEQALKRKLPVYQSYGLTETGSACAITTLTKNTLGFSGKPLPHITLKLKNKCIFLKGRSRCLGFEMPNKKEILLDPKDYYNTKDYAIITKSKHLTILGRASRMVIINGENIQLEHVESFIKSLAYVNNCYILPVTQKTTLKLYGFVEYKNSKKVSKSDINIAITNYFSSLYKLTDIFFHTFDKGLKPTDALMKKHLNNYQLKNNKD
ncbi:hypothetical protein CL657_00275 [bacterium]|nr:hypothetical protein [bacterium]|tara:strand:- start:795 stop:2108 length:1314 start_codon:yes stop_codon:yes gene_type:complete